MNLPLVRRRYPACNAALNHANVPKAREKVRLCCGDVDPGHRNLEHIGAPAFDDEAREFGLAIQTNLEMPPMDDPFVADNQRMTPPAEFEATVLRSLAPVQFRIGADDYALPPDDSYEFPGARMRLWVCQRQSVPDCSRLRRRWPHRSSSEFNECTGGGVWGTKWVASLLPRDFVLPVDQRWHEHVTTARGEEWWIPTPLSGSGAGERLCYW